MDYLGLPQMKMDNSKKMNVAMTNACQVATGKRHCSNCFSVRAVEGGRWIVAAGGTRRRWTCAECDQNAKEREAQKRKSGR